MTRASHTQLNRLEKDEHVPVFGERRSPSCVEDWLEINDFEYAPAPIDSPVKLITPANLPKNKLTIQTRFLQRENSFRSSGGSSGRTVKSIIESFSKSNHVNNESNEIRKVVNNTSSLLPPQRGNKVISNRAGIRPPKLSRSAFAYVPNSNTSFQGNVTVSCNQKPLLLTPRITSTIPKICTSSTDALSVNSTSVLASLKPARRKKRPAPRAEDIYTNSKEKQQIMQALSNMDIRSSDENYDVVIDSFSLEGEFV